MSCSTAWPRPRRPRCSPPWRAAWPRGKSDPGADLDTRLLGALELLRELGGDPVVTDAPGGARIVLEHCPLADLSAAHPEICGFGRALVEEAIGAPVESRCTRGDRPRCCFELAPLRH